MLAERRLTAETNILLEKRQNSRNHELQENNSDNRGDNSNHRYGEEELSQLIGSSVEDLEHELRQRTTAHKTVVTVLRLSEQSLDHVLTHLDAKLDWVTSADVANLSYYLHRYNRNLI